VITEFLFEHELTVYLCVFDRSSYTFSQKLFADIQAFIDDDYVRERDELFIDEDEYEEECCEAYIAPEESVLMDDDFTDDWGEPAVLQREAEPAVLSAPIVGVAPIAAAKKNVAPESDAKRQSLQEYLKSMDKSFAEMLFMYIDERGMTDVECYKKANVDRKTFSKIRSSKNYKPSKQTAIAFAIALKLNLEETQNLLATAGLTLSRSYTFDKIIMYFILNEKYDVFEINEALFEFDQMLLG